MKKYILMFGWVVLNLMMGFGQAHQGKIYVDDNCDAENPLV